MKQSHFIGALSAITFSVITLSSHAALVGRDLDGNLATAEAYYDTVADLTWVADANINGLMDWATAVAWAANLDIDGVPGPDGWRLPSTQQPDPSCDNQFNGESSGPNCTGSEMGNLYYNVLGNTEQNFTNPGPFSNVQSSFWSSTEHSDPDLAWKFDFTVGWQTLDHKVFASHSAWAVQSGDVGASLEITPWTDDFEAYTLTDCAAFYSDYLVFGSVDRPPAGPGPEDYNYGAFPAPNKSDPACGGAQFSALVTGEGDAPQGAQQLSVFADYENPDHGLAGAVLKALFYKEWTIGAANVGETWDFAFDAKLGNLELSTTAEAFIQVIDPNTGFSETTKVSVDMTTTPATWQGYVLSLTIDAAWVGQLIQIGMASTAQNFEGSGVFYDNLNFDVQAVGCVGNGTDTDTDGVDDNCDNCINVANAGQEDTDADGHGNICDGDFNQDCIVNGLDIGPLKDAFFGADLKFDLNNDGNINGLDIGPFKALFFLTPGPSGADQVPPPLCP